MELVLHFQAKQDKAKHGARVARELKLNVARELKLKNMELVLQGSVTGHRTEDGMSSPSSSDEPKISIMPCITPKAV
jgi:hypothetical protein